MEARAEEEQIARQERTRWSEEEDEKLREYMRTHGERVLHGWDAVSKGAGLSLTRNGKSCRLRWINYLRPGINHAPLVPAEEAIIIQLQKMHGNSWALIASRLQNRTEIQVKNFWNGRGKKNSEGGISNIAGGANVELLVDISGHGLPLPPNSLPPDFVSASEPNSTANPFSFPLPSATFKAWSDQEELAYSSFTSTAMVEQDEFLSTNEMQPYLHLPLQTPSPIPVTGSVPESPYTNEELMEIDPDIATFDPYAGLYPELLMDSGYGRPPTQIAAPENFLSWLVFDSEVDYFSQEQELEMTTTTNEMVEKTIEEFFTSSSNTQFRSLSRSGF